MALAVGEKKIFNYTGAAQSIVLPPGRYKLEVWGAQGGDNADANASGGKGGYSSGVISLNRNIEENTELFVYVGGQGKSSATTASFTKGGFNGGGNAGYISGGSGGGGTDIRIGTDSLYARVIVAGGGGGAFRYSGYNGGVGGGLTGGQGTGYGTAVLAGAGTQTSGGAGGVYGSSITGSAGSFGVGGNAATNSTSYNRAGGGGGGWYGGGGSAYRGSSSYYYRGGGGAGGGSGFVWTGANAPAGYLLNEEHYLTETELLDGTATITYPSGTTAVGNAGNGSARITCLEIFTFAPEVPTNLSANSTQNSVFLSWDASADATGYKVYRGGVLVADTAETTYTDTGLSPGTEYVYGVLAYNDNGDSEQAAITVKTSNWKVAGLYQSIKSVRRIGLQWDADSLATGWKVYKDDALIANVSVNTYTESGLLPDESHVYKVIAYNSSMESESAEIIASTEWAWYIQGPSIEQLIIEPSETTINTPILVRVFVDEVLRIAENIHSGEVYAGEV